MTFEDRWSKAADEQEASRRREHIHAAMQEMVADVDGHLLRLKNGLKILVNNPLMLESYCKTGELNSIEVHEMYRIAEYGLSGKLEVPQ